MDPTFLKSSSSSSPSPKSCTSDPQYIYFIVQPQNIKHVAGTSYLSHEQKATAATISSNPLLLTIPHRNYEHLIPFPITLFHQLKSTTTLLPPLKHDNLTPPLPPLSQHPFLFPSTFRCHHCTPFPFLILSFFPSYICL